MMTDGFGQMDWSDDVWWQDVLWGFWNGISAWVVLIAHVFGAWDRYPLYNSERSGNWYDIGFLLGAGSPFLGFFGRKDDGGSSNAASP